MIAEERIEAIRLGAAGGAADIWPTATISFLLTELDSRDKVIKAAKEKDEVIAAALDEAHIHGPIEVWDMVSGNRIFTFWTVSEALEYRDLLTAEQGASTLDGLMILPPGHEQAIDYADLEAI